MGESILMLKRVLYGERRKSSGHACKRSMKYTCALNGGSGFGSHWEIAPGLGLKGCFVLPYRPLSPIHTLTHMRKKNTQRGEEVGHAGWMMD